MCWCHIEISYLPGLYLLLHKSGADGGTSAAMSSHTVPPALMATDVAHAVL